MSSYYMCINDMIIINKKRGVETFFVKMNFWPLWPLDDPWGHIKYNFSSYPPMHDCNKFDRNPMKYVQEETNCQKEEERKN